MNYMAPRRANYWASLRAVISCSGNTSESDASSTEQRPIIRAFESSLMPWVFGAITSLVIARVWSGFGYAASVADEFAYLLQARIFSSGHWVANARPLPEFFEQWHTFVTPVVASKYPPGHSILLALGTLLHFPPLIPLVLSGVAGALTFALARRVAGAPTAFLTWVIWITMRGNLVFRPAFFSEATSSVCWLLAWWALWRWHDTGRGRQLVVTAAAVAWCCITRPLAGACLALPVVIVVLVLSANRKAWGQISLAATVGLVILAIIPTWSHYTTGDWLLTPLSQYTRTYMPWDRVGFGLDSTPPLRSFPPVIQRASQDFVVLHASHTEQALPAFALLDLVGVIKDGWQGWHIVLLPAAILGCLTLGYASLIAGASVVLMFLGHLLYAHPAFWTLYYLEIFPFLAFLTAVGLTATVRLCRMATLPPKSRGMSHEPGAARSLPEVAALIERTAIAPVIMGLAAILLLLGLPDIEATRVWRTQRSDARFAFHSLINSLPHTPNIVFLNFGDSLASQSMSTFVENPAYIETAKSWIVYDLGPSKDVELLRLAPSRVGYVVDFSTHTVSFISPPKGSERVSSRAPLGRSR